MRLKDVKAIILAKATQKIIHDARSRLYLLSPKDLSRREKKSNLQAASRAAAAVRMGRERKSASRAFNPARVLSAFFHDTPIERLGWPDIAKRCIFTMHLPGALRFSPFPRIEASSIVKV